MLQFWLGYPTKAELYITSKEGRAKVFMESIRVFALVNLFYMEAAQRL